MERRKFLAGVAALGAIPFISPASVKFSAKPATEQVYFELTKYTIPYGPGKDRLGNFFKDAQIPALKKMGIGPVGVFYPAYGDDSTTLYTIIQHKTIDSVLNYFPQLMEDKDFLEAGKDVLETTIDRPAYLSKDVTVLKAFKNFPEIVISENLKGKDRLFELRKYQSHNYLYGQRKIQMFNEGGEIEIFKKTGLNPVFFGETLVGADIPNLQYMLAFENMTARDKAWATFVASPEWTKLKADPQYKDTVSNISDIILKPTAYSQI